MKLKVCHLAYPVVVVLRPFENTAVPSTQNRWTRNAKTNLSTVLAQDHFYSDFLSLSLTILTHKGSMRMIIICCGVESALAFVTGGMNYSTVDYLNGSYLCNNATNAYIAKLWVHHKHRASYNANWTYMI